MQELAQDYVNQLNSFNQAHFLTFRKTFIKKFNKANLVSKVVTTNKISLADNKTQKAVSYGVSVATDILGMAAPGSGTIGKLVDDFIGSVFLGHRKKGYKKLDGISAHTTKTEILAQTLANGLQLYYQQDLCPQKITKAQLRGSMAAERVINKIKKTELTSPENTLKDWLSSILNVMISYDYTKEGIKDEKKVEELIVAFTSEELDALLLISSSQLLGLPADFMLKILKNQEDLETYKTENSEKVEELNAEVDKIFQQVDSNTAQIEDLRANKRPTYSMVALVPNSEVRNELKVDQVAVRSGNTTIPLGASDKDIENLKSVTALKQQDAQKAFDKQLTANINMVGISSNCKVGSADIKQSMFQQGDSTLTSHHNSATQALPSSTPSNIEHQGEFEPQQGHTPNPL